MVELDMEGLTLNVPLKPEMHVDEFLRIADKVERLSKGQITHEHFHNSQYTEPLSGSSENGPTMPSLPRPAPVEHNSLTEEDFKLPQEDKIKLQHVANQVRSHMDHIKRHEDSLNRHEHHLNQILEYLQSLDKYIRK